MRQLILLAGLLWLGSQPARAADTPAQMVVGEDSIEELLRIPRRLEPGRYEVQCEAGIRKDGSVHSAVCYSMSDWAAPYSLKKAVRHATRYSRFVPAMRNGQPVEVYAVLMVIVDTRLSEPLILAVPNNGLDTARYGLLYTAPQRYGEIDFWFTARPPPVRMELQIDEHGVVQECTLTNESRAPDSWVEAIRAAATRFTFMPGYHEGKPVPMRYMELMIWEH